jgi:hypothetical protein
VLPTPDTGTSDSALTEVSCPAPAACLATGYKGTLARTVRLAERWNGTSWTVVKTPALPGKSQASFGPVACSAANSCTILGSYRTSSGGVASFAEHWNGASWTVQNIPGSGFYLLGALSCPSATSCTAVGYYLNSAGTALTLAEHWDGTAWKIQPTPNPARATRSQLNGVSCPSLSVCEAVGMIHTPSATGRFRDQTLIEGN